MRKSMSFYRIFSFLAAAALLLVVWLVHAPKYSSNLYDVSWPNCSIRPLQAQTGVVGVTGGLAFRPNPCLHQEVSWFKNVELYANTGYPGRAYGVKFINSPKQCSIQDNDCLAYNYGYNSAIYAINYAKMQHVAATVWWLDVETENSWSSPAENRSALSGMVNALNYYVFLPQIGFYSYPGQWQTLTAGWQNGAPAWVATGQKNLVAAMITCLNPSFNGGAVVLSQYTTGLDKNYACAGHMPANLNLDNL